MEDNKSSRPVPDRNSYGFENIQDDGYVTIDFETSKKAMKARAAAHTMGNRTGKKFVTEIMYNDIFKDLRHTAGQEIVKVTLHVWRVD